MKRPGMGMVLGVVCSVGWPSLSVPAELLPMPVEPPLGFALLREGKAIHVVEKPGRRYYCGKKSYVVEVPGKVRHKWFWTGTGFQVRPGTAGPTSAVPSPREAVSR